MEFQADYLERRKSERPVNIFETFSMAISALRRGASVTASKVSFETPKISQIAFNHAVVPLAPKGKGAKIGFAPRRTISSKLAPKNGCAQIKWVLLPTETSSSTRT